MDVLAMMIMKNGGFLGYCHPPYTYSGSYANPASDTVGPFDPILKTAIEIMHGYQINHGFLSYLLDVIALSKNRDGRYAYQQVNYYLAKNDPPVVSITKTLSPVDGGHVLVPFYTSDLGGTKRIYVYDPNRSYYEPGADGKDWYLNLNNYIEINSGSGEWKYTMDGGDTWTGNPGSGGNLIAIPLSVAGKKDRLPQSLLADGAYALNTIFIYGDVKIEQISDPASNRHYLNKAGTNIEPCKEKRLNNILPFIPLDGAAASKNRADNTVYFFRGSRPLDLQYRAYGAYRIGAIFHGRYIEIKGNGKGSIQHFKTMDFQKRKKQSMKMILPHSKLMSNQLD
jgi:hypothetical protein